MAIEGLDIHESNVIEVRFLKISIPVSAIITALKFLKRHTKVSSFSDAVMLIHFKDLTREESEYISMLITLWRAWKDGEVEPPLNIEDVFFRIEP